MLFRSNKEIPAVKAIIEVRYLYAYKGGNLYQPTYIGVRDDIGLKDCIISQIGRASCRERV